MDDAAGKSGGKNWKQGAVFVLVIVLLGLGANALLGGKNDAKLDRRVATEACEKSVKSQLVAPRTADISDVTSHEDGGDLLIAGTVSARTADGGYDKQVWTCTATGDGDTWRGTAEITDL